MAKSGHMYRIAARKGNIPTLNQMQTALKKWTDKKTLKRTGITLRRNFANVRIKPSGGYLEGTYEADVAVPIRSRGGKKSVSPSLEEAEFAIKENGKIVFLGSKKRGSGFARDVSVSIGRIKALRASQGTCVKQKVKEKVMEDCINASEVKKITHSAFKGKLTEHTTRHILSGDNLKKSQVFAELRKAGKLYRSIVWIQINGGEIAVQITEDGSIMLYGNPTTKTFLEIIGFMERYRL